MRKLFAELRRVEARASSLSRAQRFNLALYTFALAGLGLIALEVRQTEGSSREVRSLPGPVTTAPARQPGVQPGDRRPVEGTADAPSAATDPAPAETDAAGPATASGSGGTATPGAGSGTEALGEGGAADPAMAQPVTSSPTPFAAPSPDPFGGGDAALVVPGGTGGLPAMSLVPQPPPAPSLPPPSSSRPAVDVGVPAPADPVLADPPAPRFSGPTFSALPD